MSSEAAVATADVGDGRTRINEVWHVRHGERCDEVNGAERRAWERSPRCKRGGWFDPFLTRHGHVQASRAGLYLKSLPFNQQPGGFDIVYTSPLVRAVQTAVCVSQGLGNLPLQVVPGLCSCTAALVRVGYLNAQNLLMTDAEIARAFPGVTVIPRDPLAPTRFSEAAAWLAAKASEKASAGDHGVSRILAVGHREGTKAMAGERVPTPHCCIGVFRTEAWDSRHTYRLHDLLSHKGKSLKLNGESSPYARPRATTGVDNGQRSGFDDGNSAVEALAARVVALTVSSKGSPKPKGAVSQASTSTGGGRASGAGAAGSTSRSSISRGASGMVRRIRGASSSLASTAGKDRALPGAPSSSARTAEEGSGKKTKNAYVPPLATRKPPPLRRTVSDGNGRRRETIPEDPSRKGGRSRTEAPPPPRAQESGSRRAAAAASSAATKMTGVVVSGGASGGVDSPRFVAPSGGACAGGGFRVGRRISRGGSVGGGSTFAGFLGIPADTLCGASGVLSFLSAPELCTAQATCTPIATAAANKSLWRELYSRLPKHLRDRSETGLPSAETATHHPKTLFARAASTASSAHAAKVARKVAAVARRLTAIHNLRGSVRSTKADLRVRLNGKPVGVVRTTGAKAEAWVSRSNVLGEPSVNGNDGVRAFSLSSSLKVAVPSDLETVDLLGSMCVSLFWPDEDAALLPRMPVFRIDGRPVISQARLLGTSAEGAVVLYGVAGSSGSSSSSSISSNSSSNDDTTGRFCTRRSGGGDRTGPHRAPVLRACALLGVLPSRRKDGSQGTDAGGVAFLTVHLPHGLVLDVATRRSETGDDSPESVGSGSRRSQSYGDDSAGPRHGLERFAAALGLRTAGVPLWETASTGVDGSIRTPRDVVSRRTQPLRGVGTGVAVVCFDLLHPVANGGGGSTSASAAERTLTAGPWLPFSTSGGLSGVVADVLLADFTLCDDDGMPLWAFTSPIVFEGCADAGAAEALRGGEGSGGGAEGECDGTVDMGHREVREERRRGIVAEQGVGRVIVELGLVESPGEDGGHDGRARSAASRGHCPGGHVWIVVSARAELELGFINAWFGTKHGSA